MNGTEVFWALHSDLPREGGGSDATTRELLGRARPLPGDRALDIACGPGRSALVLAEAGLRVTAVDTHEPFLDRLRVAAGDRAITVERASMADPGGSRSSPPSTCSRSTTRPRKTTSASV